MNLEMQLSVVMSGVILLLLTLERVFPWNNKLEKSKLFYLRSLFLFSLSIGVAKIGEHTWLPWMAKNFSINLISYYHPLTQGLVAYLVGTFVFYWWHRGRHEIMFLWNIFHQTHHAPIRIEAMTAFYVHPIEAVVSSIFNGLILYGLGGNQEGLLVSITLFSLVGFWTHTNIKTPKWLNYFFINPRLHLIHHQRGKHYGNFSDLPLWDILFKTYIEPEYNKPEDLKYGFKDHLELKFFKIFTFRNVLK